MKRLFLLPFFIILFSSFSFAQNNQEKVYIDYYGDGKKYELISEENSQGIYSNLARRCELDRLEAILSDKGYLGFGFVYKVKDKSAVLDDKGSTAFNIAASSNMHKCRAVARWLSDVGVKDGLVGGGVDAFIQIAPFKKPYIFEDARIKLTITYFAKDATIYALLLNKTDDDFIQYVGYKYTVNGKTEETREGTFKLPPKEEEYIRIYSYDFNKLDPQAGPKVVKNKITIDRDDIDFIYRYKGKDYKVKLKIGGKDTYDVYYTQDSIWGDEEKIRKEQLGY